MGQLYDREEMYSAYVLSCKAVFNKKGEDLTAHPMHLVVGECALPRHA